jgi:Glycosyltransferase Family 4
MPVRRKLLSISHSYVVSLNRRLANEIASLGKEEWQVTAIAPAFMQADLRPIALETDPQERVRLEAVPVYLSKHIHLMIYGWKLKQILSEQWDLVHCWEEPYIIAGGQIAGWIPDTTALVYSSFQNYSKQYPPPFNWIENYAMNRATGWIAFGQTVADALKHRPGYQRPMRLIPPGVDVNHFFPNPEAKLKFVTLWNGNKKMRLLSDIWGV